MAVETIVDYRYRLRMLGVPLKGPALLLGDNQSVIDNTTLPSSQLKKKHNAIAYHRVREAIAAGILWFAKVHTSRNLADVLNKPLGSTSFYEKVHPVLFRRPCTFPPKENVPEGPVLHSPATRMPTLADLSSNAPQEETPPLN